jgi:hypothetical protein
LKVETLWKGKEKIGLSRCICVPLFFSLNTANLYICKHYFKTCYFHFQGHESFVSHESLEQLHCLVFVLGITHVAYSFFAIALAMIKVDISLH